LSYESVENTTGRGNNDLEIPLPEEPPGHHADAYNRLQDEPVQAANRHVNRHGAGPRPPLEIISDTRMAEYFGGQVCGWLRHWAEAKKWLMYDGTRWTTDAPGGAYPAIKDVIRLLYRYASEAPTSAREAILKNLLKLEKHQTQRDILAAASNIPRLIISSSQLDQDPMLLNCLNGTIDLKTGELHPHDPANMITRMIYLEYSENALCPLFEKFLDRIMAGDQELIGYLQRFVGYCLTGLTVEQVLLFLWGTGANGKSKFLETLIALLGDFATTAGADLLMVRDRRSATNDLAGLRGSRLVSVCEFDDGERLAEATIKTLTGGDRVSCRFLYGEFFEYKPAFKILLIGNHKPKIKGRDEGIWRRIHLLPFEVTIPEEERDPHLGEKLLKELPGILAWSVRGCLEWQKRGLNPPDKVLAAVDEYRLDEDIFRQWLDECCITGAECQATPAALLESFIGFSKWKNTTPHKLGRMLKDAGFEQQRAFSGRFWVGIGLMDGKRHDEKCPF
jgi:putative DNA primase/helicase